MCGTHGNPSQEDTHGAHRGKASRPEPDTTTSVSASLRRPPRRRSARCWRPLGTASQRQRDLPAHVVVYYVIALALVHAVVHPGVLRCLLEGLQWLRGPRPGAGRRQIGSPRPARGWLAALQQLARPTRAPDRRPGDQGAWYRTWRLVSLDGSTLDVGG